MINNVKYLGAFIGFLLAFQSSAIEKSMTDNILLALIERNLPVVLHDEKSQPWDFGTYDVQIKKSGLVDLSNSTDNLQLTMPIEVVMLANVNKDFLGQRVVLACDSNFQTLTILDVSVLLNQPKSAADVKISVPVPEVFLFCDGLKLPIQPFLQQLVLDKKVDWENKLEAELQMLLKQAGI
ncbi:MAG: hypothetical protein ABJH06_01765 [Paraglaciecola sp.]|uniref:hypothetical protein n=1 Tax=Paraglaciecola sp. TaxID=1920173 RepID=UPI003299F17E